MGKYWYEIDSFDEFKIAKDLCLSGLTYKDTSSVHKIDEKILNEKGEYIDCIYRVEIPIKDYDEENMYDRGTPTGEYDIIYVSKELKRYEKYIKGEWTYAFGYYFEDANELDKYKEAEKEKINIEILEIKKDIKTLDDKLKILLSK